MDSLPAFVHLIESPAPRDLLDGRTEGRILCEAFDLAGIPHCYNQVANDQMLCESLGSRLSESWQEFGAFPILHFSMHGDQHGIQLTDGFDLTWNDLALRTEVLANALRGALIICMSTCFGATGCSMAMDESEKKPFCSLIGNMGSVSWTDAAIGFTAFYHRLFKGASIDTALDAMKQASGNNQFVKWDGRSVKNSFIEFMKQQRVSAMLQSFLNPPKNNLLVDGITGISPWTFSDLPEPADSDN